MQRIVELELHEMGYRDARLEARVRAEMLRRYESELDECVGRSLPVGALDCIREVSTTEELSHECLGEH